MITGGGAAVNRWTTKTGVLGGHLWYTVGWDAAQQRSHHRRRKKISSISYWVSRLVQHANEGNPNKWTATNPGQIVNHSTTPVPNPSGTPRVYFKASTLVPMYIFSLPCLSAPACACVVSVYSGQADSSWSRRASSNLSHKQPSYSLTIHTGPAAKDVNPGSSVPHLVMAVGDARPWPLACRLGFGEWSSVINIQRSWQVLLCR